MTDDMDAIDRQQQREIDELKNVNARQDAYIRNILWAFVLFVVIQFLTMLMLINSIKTDCPHEGCPHHQAK